jgi:hypothetical protein
LQPGAVVGESVVREDAREELRNVRKSRMNFMVIGLESLGELV